MPSQKVPEGRQNTGTIVAEPLEPMLGSVQGATFLGRITLEIWDVLGRPGVTTRIMNRTGRNDQPLIQRAIAGLSRLPSSQ